MSISAMKQAYVALGWYCRETHEAASKALRQAIAEAEKQEPVAWVENLTDPQPHAVTDLKYCSVAQRESGEDLKYVPLYPAPVHDSDINQEPVDETAKSEHEFEEMVKRGTKAWDGTPDDWVDDLRGGADKQDPDDDIYDIWVEQGTSQENRQVAMRRTTRDEKIVNPGVYEVPEFDCPRCGHCCPEREWVGLTDHELQVLDFNDPERGKLARAVEAKLKEKNN